jgi:hypothetical protein
MPQYKDRYCIIHDRYDIWGIRQSANHCALCRDARSRHHRRYHTRDALLNIHSDKERFDITHLKQRSNVVYLLLCKELKIGIHRQGQILCSHEGGPDYSVLDRTPNVKLLRRE